MYICIYEYENVCMVTSGDSRDAVVYGHEDAAVRVQDSLHGLVVDA